MGIQGNNAADTEAKAAALAAADIPDDPAYPATLAYTRRLMKEQAYQAFRSH